jgi:CheY-like chemotaxis protein
MSDFRRAGPTRLLIVDDDPANLDLLHRCREEDG